MPNSVPISEGGKLILDTVQKELFPVINQLGELLIDVQKCRIRIPLYSLKLEKLDKRYDKLTTDFFEIDRKLRTPDIIFKDLPEAAAASAISEYFTYQSAFMKNLDEGSRYIEIIDRVLDRKTQGIQNFWSFLLALIAIIVSILYR